MKQGPVILLTASLFLINLSCSGSSGGPSDPGLPSNLSSTDNQSTRNTHLWGLWDVFIDPLTGEIDAVPLRGAAFSCNVVGFIDGPPSNLHLALGTINVQPTFTDIQVDIGLEHPFPELNAFTGFDILGVFMGNGTDTYHGTGGFPVAGPNDQQLLNPDGLTRWFNAPEFGGVGLPLLAYTPGQLGTPGYTPSAELNPYKYFADGLPPEYNEFSFLVYNYSARGSFTPGSENHRSYELRFPTSTGFTFQYAVIAHWKPSGMADPLPADFPPEANAEEALVIDILDSSDLYYIDETNYGGTVILNISPWDWSSSCASGEIEYEIKCYSDAWAGEYSVGMNPIGQSNNVCTFHVEIPVETLTSNDPLTVWIEIIYPALDYSNDFGAINDADGPLTSYFIIEIPVSPGDSGWCITWGGSGSDRCYALAVDSAGSSYTTGYRSAPNKQIFLAKVDPDGNLQFELTWGSDTTDYGNGVAVGDSGGIYVTGYFLDSADFNPWGDPDIHASNGSQDVFLSKFNSTGDFQWARTWGGPGVESGNAVAVDSSENVYVTGYFNDTVDFNPSGGAPKTVIGNSDVYLCKYNSNGEFQWVQTWGGLMNDTGYGMSIDGSDFVYISGDFNGTADFNPEGGATQSSNGAMDVFLSRFDSAGVFDWVRTWGGVSLDRGYAVDADASGMVHVTGSFVDTVDFNPWSGPDSHTSNGSEDVYLSVFNSAGDFQWVRTWGGLNEDDGYALSADGYGHIYVTGGFFGDVDFDPGGGTDQHVSVGDDDVFLSGFDSLGNFEWARTWGGTNLDHGLGIDNDAIGNIYVGGRFRYSGDFAPSDAPCNEDPDIHSSTGACDIFVCRYLPDGCW